MISAGLPLTVETTIQVREFSLSNDIESQTLMASPMSAKGRLLEKAASLFNEKGYERTTVRDLAAAVGIQSGSIFHHFKTKEDILVAVMTEAIIYNTNRMNQKLALAHTAKEEVLALITCELESVIGVTGDAMAVLVYEWRSLSKSNQQAILKLRDQYERLWIDALNKAKAEGKIQADTFILRRFLTGALSWTTTWFKRDGDITLEALAEEALLLAIK